MKTLILSFVLCLFASGAFAGCGGGGYSLAKMTPQERAALEAEVAAGKAKVARIERRLATLDKLIAVTEIVVFTYEQAAGLVPYGGLVAAGSQALGYAVMGETDEAMDIVDGTAVSGVIGLVPGGNAINTANDIQEGVGLLGGAVDAFSE